MVDLLIENGPKLQAIEIKSSATMKNDFFNSLQLFQSFSGINAENLFVVYGGDTDYSWNHGSPDGRIRWCRFAIGFEYHGLKQPAIAHG